MRFLLEWGYLTLSCLHPSGRAGIRHECWNYIGIWITSVTLTRLIFFTHVCNGAKPTITICVREWVTQTECSNINCICSGWVQTQKKGLGLGQARLVSPWLGQVQTEKCRLSCTLVRVHSTHAHTRTRTHTHAHTPAQAATATHRGSNSVGNTVVNTLLNYWE